MLFRLKQYFEMPLRLGWHARRAAYWRYARAKRFAKGTVSNAVQIAKVAVWTVLVGATLGFGVFAYRAYDYRFDDTLPRTSVRCADGAERYATENVDACKFHGGVARDRTPAPSKPKPPPVARFCADGSTTHAISGACSYHGGLRD